MVVFSGTGLTVGPHIVGIARIMDQIQGGTYMPFRPKRAVVDRDKRQQSEESGYIKRPIMAIVSAFLSNV